MTGGQQHLPRALTSFNKENNHIPSIERRFDFPSLKRIFDFLNGMSYILYILISWSYLSLIYMIRKRSYFLEFLE